LFLLADSYRKSAHLLGAASSTTQPTTQPDPADILAAKKDRLQKAGELYERVIAAYASKPPVDDMDKLYVKLSHFYRADCAYDLGDYEQAIRLYNTAAQRYQDDTSTLSAYVQIVNSYCALGKFDEARTANERAQVLLKRIPQETFADGSFSLPKEYWSDWLKWTGDSGLWK
jgi:tetratricopeptide (TPR) repeat protein